VFKIKDEKRTKFIKVMLTEKEYKKVERYSHLKFQTKSRFIRSAIRTKIDEINASIYPNKTDPRFKKGRVNRRDVMKELKDYQLAHNQGELLKKPSEEEQIARENLLEERKKDIEKELERIEQALKENKSA
jgi:hypothetical protein